MTPAELLNIINQFVEKDSGNMMPGRSTLIFNKPLIAFASANDPLFDKLQQKEVVSPLHRKPNDWLPNAQTVISYSLPFYSEIIQTNCNGVSCSEEWLYARFHGEEFNNRLRRLIVAALQADGFNAIAPLISPDFTVTDMKSNWSERHAAFIAGLGTFGLNRGIITKKGLAGRIGSVITDLKIEPTYRTYTKIYEHCPWFEENKCGACINKCPSGALGPNGKDLVKCNDYLKNIEGEKVRAKYGFPFSACGKCFACVPCEKEIPIN